MCGHTRRSFLRHSMMAGGAVALGGATLARAQESGEVQMAIARWKGEKEAPMNIEATKLTEQAIAALGGMKRFVSNGDIVWIKPNMAWNRAPELAANTNPDVVATLVRLCYDAGAKRVKVGDRTCHKAQESYIASGIEAAAKAVDAEVIYLDDSRFREMEIKGERLDKWEVYPEIIETDLVINVPIAKDHTIAHTTACMKNYMGVVGGNRGQWHQELASCLCDITAFMKPRLSVVDMTRVMVSNGPTGGSPDDVRRVDMVAAGTDVVALDTLSTEMIGRNPAEILSVKAAFERGLGQMDYRKLVLKELEVA